jgi:hypothetical protein
LGDGGSAIRGGIEHALGGDYDTYEAYAEDDEENDR